ncbi:MFS transporter [Paracoccus marinaquae]|uniref:MFS transporter n=1 Tax=Paracoccus marinaquae TaxID=2841926 RepID=A0ABS6AIH7_9RHOB|nr:MFS transporter [Paracoccus marinaquae]MBU3030403.1 MFS transporter [Paracoccus marinaquae]
MTRPPSSISVALAGLYLAQSVPLYLVAAALPPILRARGVDLAVIGAFGVLLAPWVLKAAWAPLVDRLARLPGIGRKGVVAICLVLTLACVALLSTLDPVTDAIRFFPILMAMSLSSATQDIASDGWAVEHLPPEQQAFGNGIQAGAVAFGVLIGGSGTLLLVDLLGWQATLLSIAAIAGVAALPFLLLPEAHDRRDLPADYGRASFGHFLSLPMAGSMLAFAFFFRMPEGLVKALEQPFLVDQGFSLSQVGLITGGSAALVGLFGAAIAAGIIDRIGLRPFFVALIVGRTLAFAAFFAAATLGIGTWPLLALSGVDTFLRYVEMVGLYTAFMRFSSLAQAGTDFTLLTSVNLLMYMLGGMIAGAMASAFGYGPVFALAVVLSALTGWIAMTRLPEAVRRPALSPDIPKEYPA